MKLILFKVHEEYESRFVDYVKRNGFDSIEVARTGDYLEYGHSLHLIYCESDQVQGMIEELKAESKNYSDESFANIELFVLNTKEKTSND